MPSTPGDGRGSRQLKIPQAPRFDRFGMHARDCECTRCDLGMGPTNAERYAAERAWARIEAKKKADAERAAAGLSKRTERATKKQAAAREREKFTDELIRKLNQPIAEPATPEQLAELKRAYPNLTKKDHGR